MGCVLGSELVGSEVVSDGVGSEVVSSDVDGSEVAGAGVGCTVVTGKVVVNGTSCVQVTTAMGLASSGLTGTIETASTDTVP